MGLFIESVSFSDAMAMLEACRAELARCGFQSQADMLRGIEIFDASGADVAVCTLRSLPPANQDTDATKRYTIDYLVTVLRTALKAS
jgi:hypothetical protein